MRNLAQFAIAALLVSAMACNKEAPKPTEVAAPTADKPGEPVKAPEPAAVAAVPAAAPAADKPVDAAAALRDPTLAKLSAPAEFKVKVSTTKGDFVLAIHKAWSPKGVDRFYNMVKIGYFQDLAFFRAVAGFMCQFGIHGDPTVNNVWKEASIDDDPPANQSNLHYRITFAKKGIPNSRSVQFFINFKDNAMLDGMGFTPFGEVVEGKDVVDKVNTEYGEGAPGGNGPNQMRVQAEGNAYLKKDFPNLDYIKSVTLL